MDEDPTKISYQEEIDIDLNDLFTIEFKNLKIFLTKLLKNQNEMSHKIKDLENKLNDQETKTYKNISYIEKRVKIIEKNNSINKSQKEDLPKELKEKKDKKDKDKDRDKDKDMDKDKDKDRDKNRDKEKDKDKDKDKTKKEKYSTSSTSGIEIKGDKEENKNKENEIYNISKEEIIINKIENDLENKNIDNNIENNNENDEKDINIKKKRNKKKENEEEKKNDTIPEESIKSEIESESELNNLNESQNNYDKSKYPRKLEDPYRNTSKINNNKEKIDELFAKYNLMNVDIEEIKKKIDGVDKKNKAIERGSRFLSLKSFDSIPSEEISFLKLQIKDLQNRNNDLDKENENLKKDLEEIKVKIKDFDIYEIFKDVKLDQGSIDASRALIMSLEQKVFKKTGLIDEKIRRLEDGINKMEVENKNTKNIAEILKLSSEDIRRMIKNLEELENKNSEDNLNILNDINEFKNEYKKNNINLDKKINDINNNNNNLLDKLQKNLNNIEQRLIETENNISQFEKGIKTADDTVNSEHFKKLKLEFTETIKELKNKDSDLEKKIEILIANQDLKKVKEDIMKLEKELSQKINNKDFLDLKEKISQQNLNISNIRDNIDRISEISNKAKNDMGFLLKRLEALSAAQVATRTALDELIGKEQEFIFDSSKYLELVSFNKFLAGFQKEKEKNEQNLNVIHKLINDMAEIIKTKSSSEDMKTFEEIINNKLEELKLYSIKKFTDKIENNKNIKYLDSQIRHIIDVYIKKLDKADSWLIAKKPLGGYSCASCEAYLGELKKSQDYKPWNKYPNRERENNFRLGNGFSRMLSMLNVDFKNQIDAIKDNLYESDNEKDKDKDNDNIEFNSPQPKYSKRRLSKNLSTANIHNININNINTGNNTNKNILPKITFNKAEDLNVNLSMDNDSSDNKKINESEGANNENEKLKINVDHNDYQPHVVKVYRKNKGNISEIHKKV